MKGLRLAPSEFGRGSRKVAFTRERALRTARDTCAFANIGAPQRSTVGWAARGARQSPLPRKATVNAESYFLKS